MRYLVGCCLDVSSRWDIHTAKHNSREFPRKVKDPGGQGDQLKVRITHLPVYLQLTYMHTPSPLTFPESQVLSACITLKPSRLTSVSGTGQVSVKAMTHASLNDASTRHLACSRSSLFFNERTFERMIEGRGGLKGRRLSLQHTPPAPTSFPIWSGSYIRWDRDGWIQLTVDGVL